MAPEPSSGQVGFVVGVDIGGSKIAAGLVTPDGEIRYHTRVPMLPNDGPDTGLATVIKAVDQVCAKVADSGCKSRLTGVGICCPGPLDPKTGVIVNPPNLPCWRGRRDFAEIQSSGEGRQRCQCRGIGRVLVGRGTRLSQHSADHPGDGHRNGNCLRWPHLSRTHWRGGRRRPRQH